MLDSATKHRIDNARDVLVGKVPDPKAQVEQITTALIYKFMDDMDQESVGMGGKASFFVGEYAKYAWPKIMTKTHSGYERLGLYSEAITKMSQNPHLPALFCDIFKDAFLPYNDPETLNLFLKEIDGFKYDHSERLGDAFEYLLSVLGSQGAAGQFRTPRHIIDFIVEAVDPGKTDSVLDPACGTAGFLISAYKHILAKQQEKKLSPDEMAQLTRNFVGYDIAPEMVRLSLVNMYLHKFPNPTVFEYDTLTSEERWDDSFDVILANPPFMTPKGGIRPHSRFSVQARRSEVLFVDYIAEHLNPEGRAGVIVPEGIIFQSSNAYKALRKMLIEENYLYAVVSLPAGVFNPYSGVKTSILLLDKRLAKQTDKILFINIENDGFNLGAQRGKIEGSDFPEALRMIKAFQLDPTIEIMNPDLALSIEKSKIGKDGDFNFSGTRYKDIIDLSNVAWPLVELGNEEFFSIESGGTPSSSRAEYWGGNIQWATLVDLPQDNLITKIKSTKRTISQKGLENSSAKLIPVNSILISSRATIGRIAINEVELATNQGFKNIVINNKEKADFRFIAYMLTRLVDRMEELGTGGTYKEISKNNISTLKIPLPPLDVQQEIVEEIEEYQKIIDGARQVVENYKPRIKVDPEWPLVELGEVCEKITDGTHKTPKYTTSGIPFLRVTDITLSNDSKKFISKDEHSELIKRCKPEFGDVLYSKNGTIGVAKMVDWKWEFSIFVSLALLKPKKGILSSKYLEFFLNSIDAKRQATAHSKSGTVTNLHLVEIKQITIPLPSIETQKIIVERIESEQEMVDANKKLIEIFEKKIEETIGRVWGEE